MGLIEQITKGSPKLPDVSNQLKDLKNTFTIDNLGKSVENLIKKTIEATINTFKGFGELFKNNSKEYSWATGGILGLLTGLKDIIPKITEDKEKGEIKNEEIEDPETNNEEEILDHTEIKSVPYEKSDTGTSLCSLIAYKNAKQFDINLPRNGSAAKIKEDYIKYEKLGLITTKRANDNKSLSSVLSGTDGKFFDLVVKSKTENGKKYGHRAFAFKDSNDGKIYVLDPSIHQVFKNGRLNPTEDAIPLEKYRWNVEFAVPVTKKLSLLGSITNKQKGYKNT